MSLEERIARLEAIEAIKALKARYFLACDRKQPALVRSCFAEGPIDLQYGRIGKFSDREQMIAVFTELACNEHIVEMHHGQNPQIRLIDENNAAASWGLYYYMIDTQRQVSTQLGGVYDDEYRRVAGEWLITRSHYEVLSTQILDLSQGQARVVFAGGAAPVHLDDPSMQASSEKAD